MIKEKFLNFVNSPYLNWLLVVVYAMIIFNFSSMTATELSAAVPAVEYFPDWILHFAEYFILGVLVYRALFVSGYKKKAVLLAVVLTFAYALSDEIHQLFISERLFSLKDIIVDTIGASVAQIGGLKKIFLK